MCGRYALYGPRSRSRAEVEYFSGLEQFPGSWNVAPGQPLPNTRLKDGAIEQFTARWGLVANWSKEEKISYKCINARAETIATAPAFRDAYKSKRRCLVPACARALSGRRCGDKCSHDGNGPARVGSSSQRLHTPIRVLAASLNRRRIDTDSPKPQQVKGAARSRPSSTS